MTAKPLTRHEWDNLRPAKRDGVLRASDLDDEALSDRIEATIENGGWASDPPTPYELDWWAARTVMGWIQNGTVWAKPADTIAGYQNVIEIRDWKPSVDLGQALECVCTLGRAYDLATYTNGHTDVHMTSRGATARVYDGPYDEAAMAEAIMRKLHAEVGS